MEMMMSDAEKILCTMFERGEISQIELAAALTELYKVDGVPVDHVSETPKRSKMSFAGKLAVAISLVVVAMLVYQSVIFHVKYSPEERAAIRHENEQRAAKNKEASRVASETAAKEAERRRLVRDREARITELDAVQKEAERQASPEYKLDGCFSRYDSNSARTMNKTIKANLADPDSFQHIQTIFEYKGDYAVTTTKFRSRNGFGGMVVAYASGNVRLSDDTCAVTSFALAK
jgi:heme exporter protein D